MNVDLLTLVWCVSVTYGIYRGVVGVSGYLYRLKLLRERGTNGIRQMHAQSAIRREAGRLLVQAVYGFIGFGALFGFSWVLAFVPLGLVLSEIVMVANTSLDQRDDERLRAAIEQREAETTHHVVQRMTDAVVEEEKQIEGRRTDG